MGLNKTGKLWSHDGTIEVTAFGGDHFVFIRNPDGQPLLRMAAVSLDDGKTVSKPATIAIADNIVTRLNIGEEELLKGEIVPEEKTQHLSFIAMGSDLSWGKGCSLKEARSNYKKAGGNAKKAKCYVEFICISDLPFAPTDREANDNEADAWVNEMGGIVHIRCEVHELK